ncbi:hypothetical protein SteCoe_28623 [Stentor coeruleus]|uniref:Uncharacterized protein n=1 Tax=Stentor coeruleus TaxID=5963 RepID=A0A1R2B7P8_9CILI|nr:hypothetical protein SteCoe_28623 [Stentor coeruleus]
MTEEAKIFNLALVGDSKSGKTCLVNRYLDGSFNPDQDPTTGAAYFTKDIKINDEDFKLNIWDTSGQPKYESVFNLSIKYSNAFIIVCDVENEDPISSLSKWHNKIMINAVKESPSIAIFINKIDLETPENKDNVRKIEEFGDSLNISTFKGSALDNINTVVVFKKIIKIAFSISSTIIRKSLTLSSKRHSKKIIENEKRRQSCCN